MALDPKYMYLGIEGDSQNWRVLFDGEMIDELCKDDGWLFFEAIQENGETKKRIYNPVCGPVKFIDWIEK